MIEQKESSPGSDKQGGDQASPASQPGNPFDYRKEYLGPSGPTNGTGEDDGKRIDYRKEYLKHLGLSGPTNGTGEDDGTRTHMIPTLSTDLQPGIREFLRDIPLLPPNKERDFGRDR